MQEPKRRLTTAFWWLLFIGLFIFLFATHKSNKPDRFLQFASFQHDVSQGNVAHVAVEDNTIAVSLRDGQEYYTLGVVNDSLTSQLSDQGVHVVRDKSSSDWTFIFWIFIVVFAVVVFFVIRARRQNGGMGNWFTFRKTRARLIPDLSKVTFADVGGCDEAKELLQDVVDYLKNPKRWEQAQVRPPRGILLEGPPGCGKTLLARARCRRNQFQILSQPRVGIRRDVRRRRRRPRPRHVRNRKQTTPPRSIFIDELDAVGRRRGSGIGAGNDEREQTLNQLLLCIDGIEDRKPVVVIAATNRPDILDSALLRPGRFDRRIHIPILSREARIANPAHSHEGEAARRRRSRSKRWPTRPRGSAVRSSNAWPTRPPCSPCAALATPTANRSKSASTISKTPCVP